ncbi:MAG: hypothetical protein JNK37_02770 [Verrucomicrobiales bacterium]|nr:hypothetical protein [Verrucomicrobiales bacterium]
MIINHQHLKPTMKTNPILFTLVATLALTSCGEKAESPAQSTNPRLQALFVAEEPKGALSVLEARKSGQPGAEITVVGRVAGVMEPFSKDFATLVLADDTVMTCDRNPGDACETPWDACCVEPKVLAASRLSVQVMGDGGQPITQTLKGVNGLKELDRLIIQGRVAQGSNADNLIIEATGIFPKPL